MPAWFDHDDVLEASAQRRYGAILYAARTAAGFSQGEVAQRLGVAISTVSRLEAGLLPMRDVHRLRQISRALSIPPHLFDLSADDHVTGTLAAIDVDTEVVREMRRRQVLTGLAASAAALPGLRDKASPLLSQLDAAVFRLPGPVQPMALPRLARTIALTRKLFDACQWRSLAAHLPDLLALAKASRDDAPHDQRCAYDAALAQVYVLGNELAIKLHETPAAWVLAERGLAAADASGDPRITARAQWRVAVSLRRAGHRDRATQVATRAAHDLHDATGLHTGEDAGFYARLLCCAAYTEAMADRRENAYDLLGRARDTASAHPYSTFGFDQIDGYGISVARAVGDFDAAVQFSRQVRLSLLDTVERRTRFYEDTAIAWWARGNPEQTFRALLAAERIAPQEVRFRPWAHRLAVNLLSCPRNTIGLAGLREFAARIGVGTG